MRLILSWHLLNVWKYHDITVLVIIGDSSDLSADDVVIYGVSLLTSPVQ